MHSAIDIISIMDSRVHFEYYAYSLHIVMIGFVWAPVILPIVCHGYFTEIGEIKELLKCQWSNPEKYGKTNHMNL